MLVPGSCWHQTTVSQPCGTNGTWCPEELLRDCTVTMNVHRGVEETQKVEQAGPSSALMAVPELAGKDYQGRQLTRM